MATLRDIAQHLGVSESTVSLVLNGKGRVSAATRARVLAYSEAVDYRPNQWAQALKRQAAHSIGVVVPDISNEFYALLFKALDSRLSRDGFTPILFNIGGDLDREQEFVDHLLSSTVDGLVVATAGSGVYAGLARSSLSRLVFVDNLPAGPIADCAFVGADNVDSSYRLTQHLVERGHTRIATLMGSVGESSARDRLQGFQRCLADNGIEARQDWVARTNFQYADGLAKTEELLSLPEPPTAVVAQNNVLAYAAFRVARSRALAVPADVAIACFDHLDTYGFMRPVITTVVQPLEHMAELACNLLREGIAGRRGGSQHYLPATLQVGETT